MDNIKLLHLKKINFTKKICSRSLAIDWELKVSYFVAERKLYSVNLHDNKLTFLHELILDDYEIICSNFIIEDRLYFLLFRNGRIITYDSLNFELMQHQISVDSDDLLHDGKFSHDQELLAIVTKNKKMLLLNKIMIEQTKYDMNQDDYGTNEMVNVNWGSKSTQFHGEGMRDKRVVKEDFFQLCKWDNLKCYLDWRGDDNHFVVNFVTIKGFRMLKLFNRQGILQHTSEYVPGLENCIAWKPSGTLIACSQMLPNRHSIVFFEKNGLKHGEFDLNYSPNSFVIDHLSWSCDSELFLISGFEIIWENDDYRKTKQKIMLYTSSNYHWYLKQTIQFEIDDSINNIVRDEQEFFNIYFTSINGTFYRKSFIKSLDATDDGRILVVDGNCLHVSDFEQTLIPPPFSTYSITFDDAPIVQLCCSEGNLIICLLNGKIILFETKEKTLEECMDLSNGIKYDFKNVYSEFSSLYFPICVAKCERIVELTLPIMMKNEQVFGLIHDKIVSFQVNQSENVEIRSLSCVDENITAIQQLSEKELILSGISGRLYLFDTKDNSLNEYFSNFNGIYNSHPIRLMVHHDDNYQQKHIIAFTNRYSLYYDQYLIMSSMVNSVMLHRNRHLLFSTSDSQFYCWPLSLSSSFDLQYFNRTYPPRSLEKGSKILTTSSTQAKVVVQLPRGNLEAFYPKVLLLEQVGHYLDKLEYEMAFEILRRNRIDLNYICDYNYQLFIDNCQKFIEQIAVKHIDWICLFLSDLSAKNSYAILHFQSESALIDEKVDSICDLMHTNMIKMDQIKFCNAILLTYIKREKPQIESALQMIRNLPTNKSRDDAIKYLLYIVNVNRLFDCALGTYDFDILLMVASKSDKDPKEYHALINEFKSIENEHYRRYRIDMHLQRYDRAFKHLSQCENRYDETLELIAEKRLFKEAIEIFDLNNNSDSDERKQNIWNIYGDYLFKKKYYREAAIVYNRAGNHSQTLKMHLMNSNWNLATVAARKMTKTNRDEFIKLAHSICQQLILNGRHIDGAYILEHYLNDPREAFRTLVRGNKWDYAVRLFYDHSELEESLLKEELKTELMEAYESLIESIENNSEKLQTHFNRLKELRQQQQQQAQTFNGYNKNEIDECENYSDTSSMFDSSSIKSSDSINSTSSLKTNLSNTRIRSLKRQEQRKYILKRGSPNEDFQLIYAIKELINQRCQELFVSESLICTLYDQFMVKQSETLQQQLVSLHSLIIKIIDYIWNSEHFQRRLVEDETLKIAPKINAESQSSWSIVLNGNH